MQPQQAVISEAMPSAARSTKQEMYNAGTASLVHPSISLPAGWTSKTVPRKSGKSAGSKDTYYYSAEKEIKFRSAKECNKFIQILDLEGKDFRLLLDLLLSFKISIMSLENMY